MNARNLKPFNSSNFGKQKNSMKVIYLFLVLLPGIFSCQMSGQSAVPQTTEGTPTARQLRQALHDKREILLVHSNGAMLEKYQQVAQKIAAASPFLFHSVRCRRSSQRNRPKQ